jgi:hypothetical protein
MADELKAATLRPANDRELLDLVQNAIATIYTSLADAKIWMLWALGKPVSFWGRVEVATEKMWWVSGALEGGGADIVLQINETLWGKLSTAGRKFVVDHFLDQVRRKTGGQTEMETEEGIRLLYEKEEGTLKLNPRVCARHPKGLREIDEVKKLWIAMAKPSQYEIEFPSEAPEDGDEGQDGEGDDKPRRAQRAAPREVPPPIYYYERCMLAKHGPTAVRYTEADRRPESAVGIHFFPDTAVAQEAGDLAALEYNMTPAAVKPVRDELIADHEERAAGGERLAQIEETVAADAVAH